MTLVSRHRERDREALAALDELVHGVTCAACGMRALGTGVVERTALDGRILRYSTCDTCAALERTGRLDREVAAEVLDIDPEASVLEAVTVPRFADQPEARPDRPNGYPWQHVNERTLARAVERARLDLARTTSATPCPWCGTVALDPEQGWHDGPFGSECSRCAWRFNAGYARYRVEVARSYAAMVLMGIGDHADVGPTGGQLGESTGLRFFHELGPGAKGARGPWAWLTAAEVRRWCRERGWPDDRVFTIGW